MQALYHLFVDVFNQGYWCGVGDCIIVLGCFALGYITFRAIKHFARI